MTSSKLTILSRLRAGQRWLTNQHRLWLGDDSAAASDEEFSRALAAWDALERVFRCTGYTGCIWGADKHCSEDGPVVCDGCVKEPIEEPPEQLALGVGGGHRTPAA